MDIAGSVEILEPGITISMHPSTISGQVILRVLAFAVGGEAIPTGGRDGAAPGALVAAIGPKPCRLGLACSRRLHRDRRVVGEDRLSRQHMSPDGISQRFQKGGRLAHPVRQRRAIQIETFTLEYLALAIERQMIGVFGAYAAPLGPRSPATC